MKLVDRAEARTMIMLAWYSVIATERVGGDISFAQGQFSGVCHFALQLGIIDTDDIEICKHNATLLQED